MTVHILKIEIIEKLTTLTKEYVLDGDYLIGRDRTCNIVLDRPSVSRKHATLVKIGSSYCITDGFRMRPSTQGITVNGDRVLSRQLKSGDVITFVDSANPNIVIRGYYKISGEEDDKLKTIPHFRSD